ncbi:MAG TPA: hypothetical protein VJW75_07395 [Candidatus Eisenbacteria bacterium]|nr:hypothetical protein [Candidatus Eisenbacteria bacterium]
MTTKEREANSGSPGPKVEEPKNPETAVMLGRGLISEAEKGTTPSARRVLRLEAAGHFRTAIRMNAAHEEAYGWLAHALRLVGQDIRESNAEAADDYLRLACAVAWEAKSKTQAAALSGRTRQEAKILIAWLRATRHLTIDEAESEMETLRTQRLSEALESEAVAGASQNPSAPAST